MILELQIAAEKLRQTLLRQIQTRIFCKTSIVHALGKDFLLDHVDVREDSSLGRASGQQTVHRPSGDQTLDAAVVQYVQPVTLFLVTRADLAMNGAGASPALSATVDVSFELSLGVR